MLLYLPRRRRERMPLPKDAVLLYGVIWRED